MNKPIMWPLCSCGFSLIELITTLTITSILLAIGIPSLQTITQHNQMSAAINMVTTHLNLARSEAVTRGIDVVLCPSLNGNDCTKTVRWDSGFIMYVDNNRNRKIDPEELLLRHINMTPDSIRISSTPGRKKTVYSPYGDVYGYNLSLTFCDDTNRVDPKAVIVNNTGRARLSSTNSKGKPLDCTIN